MNHLTAWTIDLQPYLDLDINVYDILMCMMNKVPLFI